MQNVTKYSSMKFSNQRRFAVGVGAALFLCARGVRAETSRCGGHGGVAGCDPSSGRVLCEDGSLDMRYSCSAKGHRTQAHKPHPPKTRVLKFKPATNNGQILSPGEKPSPTTLEDSK